MPAHLSGTPWGRGPSNGPEVAHSLTQHFLGACSAFLEKENIMAEVSFVGNLGADPELRFTKDGKAVLDFSVAENHSKRGPNGEWTTTGTTWWRVSVWERQAEALANTLSKGDRVLVVGRSQTKEFTSKDGQQGKSLECQASRVGVVPKPPEQGGMQYAGRAADVNYGGQAAPSWGAGVGQAAAPEWGQQEAPF